MLHHILWNLFCCWMKCVVILIIICFVDVIFCCYDFCFTTFLHILTNYVAFLKYWYIYDFGYLFMAFWWSHLKVYVHFNVSFSKFKMQNISQMMMTLKSNDALTHSLNAIKTYFWQTKFDICHFFLFSYLSCAF